MIQCNSEQHEPFYLHDPNAVVYNRVHELFSTSKSKSKSQQKTSLKHSTGSSQEPAMAPSEFSTTSSTGSVSSEDMTSLTIGDDNNNVLQPAQAPVTPSNQRSYLIIIQYSLIFIIINFFMTDNWKLSYFLPINWTILTRKTQMTL